MARYAMLIDQERCVGCQSCTVACKSEWNVPIGGARTRVRSAGTSGEYPKFTSAFYVSQCNHCDHPSCVPACPSGATYQDDNGVVRVNKELCIGCGSCVAACPYDARYIDSKRGVVDKCDFCSDRVAKGLEPACVATCPAKAKMFGNLEDTGSPLFRAVYRESARRMESSLVSIGPNVYYSGRPEHAELAAAAFPPHLPHQVMATRVWGALGKKLVYLAVGATFLGQAVAFFRQLSTGEKQFED
jgi:tetrathionate reductase subunit B